MARIRISAAVLAAASLAAAVWAAGAVAAADPPSVTVKGTQTIVNESKGKFAVQGDLLGTWDVTAFTIHYQGPDGKFVGSGKELFKGCRDGDRNGSCDAGESKGTIRFTFIYWATYNPKTRALVKGQCVHPTLGGTGAFAGVKGVIHMVDRPSAKGVKTTYTGTLSYRGASSAATSALVTRELAGRSAPPLLRRLTLADGEKAPARRGLRPSMPAPSRRSSCDSAGRPGRARSSGSPRHASSRGVRTGAPPSRPRCRA